MPISRISWWRKAASLRHRSGHWERTGRQALLCTHLSRLGCVLAPGFSSQPHTASCWGVCPALAGTAAVRPNFSKCSLLSDSVFLLRIQCDVLLLKSSAGASPCHGRPDAPSRHTSAVSLSPQAAASSLGTGGSGSSLDVSEQYCLLLLVLCSAGCVLH